MNNSGKIAVFQWASTKGLNVTLTSPTPSLAISLNQSSIYLPLAAGSTATNSSLGITVTSNTPFTVKVADNTARGSHAGSMGSYTSGVYDAAGPTLASPLTLIGTTSGTTAGSMVTGPTAAGSTLYTGGVAVTNQLLAPNTFSQPVVISDPHLLTGSTYKIDLLFTITAN